MEHLTTLLDAYASDVRRLLRSHSTTEQTYYPAVHDLWTGIVRHLQLQFDVRFGTSEGRLSGADHPDVAFYDKGDFLAVCGEVKLPDEDIEALAATTAHNDQIGRYLAQTGVVLLTTVRAFALVACKPAYRRTPGATVAPEHRDVVHVVELWGSVAELRRGAALRPEVASELSDLIERALTEFAPIATPEALARVLARQARHAKASLPATFDAARTLLKDYGQALGLSFTDEEGLEFFRSSLIQTAYYAVFAAWTVWHRKADGSVFHWTRLRDYLNIKFLAGLFHEFQNPYRLEELGLAPHLDRAVATLGRVDRGAFFGAFTFPTIHGGEDPDATSAITYFYEPFLESFDPELRKELGVWYTPPEIVRYQVQRVDQLLRKLGCPLGFADERVVVLDPACGTGAYLLEVLRLVAESLLARGNDATLGAEILDAICHRIVGFEILTAPFVIAQLQIHLLLQDLGVTPKKDDRPAVFLTNALTGWDSGDQIKLNFPELEEEHEAARKIKKNARIIVILGNPPYNRFAGTAMHEEADLVDHYKGIRRVVRKKKGKDALVQDGESELYTRWGIRKQLLDDLYIRFFRLAEKRIGEKAEYGVVSFISNASYLTGRSHPLMRESLLRSFHEIWIDNTNGDKYRTGKIIPAGEPGAGTADQSVFTTQQDPRGIQVGTCVSTFVKRKTPKAAADVARVHYRDFWGRADLKRSGLLASLALDDWPLDKQHEATLRPEGPRGYETVKVSEKNRWMFAPRDENLGYEAWPALDELFPTSYQGVNSNRGLDGSVVDVSETGLVGRMQAYFAAPTFTQAAMAAPALAKSYAGYDPAEAWTTLRSSGGFKRERVTRHLMFPLDAWWLYYELGAKLLNRPRPEFSENLDNNEFFVTVPQPRRSSEARSLIATSLVDLHVHDRGSVCFPRHSSGGGLLTTRAANLHANAWKTLSSAWNLGGDLHDPPAEALVADLFRVALAVMHAPQYQQDHADSLAQDWAHIPVPADRALFSELMALGNDVAVLLNPDADPDPVITKHLGASRAAALAKARKPNGGAVAADDLRVEISYFGAAKGRWSPRGFTPDEQPLETWGEQTGDLYINADVCFANVPQRVWAFELGGYPVLKKWLGYRHVERREGAPITLAEQRHFRSMVQRLATLLAMAASLDSTYVRASSAAFTAERLGVR